MKSYRIEMTDMAEDDLESVGDYISHVLKNPTAAGNMVKGIRKQINSLKNFPERNQLDEDGLLAALGVRKDHYRDYKIYYTVDADAVYIIRILHALVDGNARVRRTFGL